MHTCRSKGCRWPTLLRRRQLRCWPGAQPWLISTTKSQLTTPYSAPYSSAAFSVALSRDQPRGWQCPPGWISRIHIGRQESSHLHTPCSSHGSSRLWELPWNNTTTHFSLTFPNGGNRKNSKAIGRTREGHHIFICHELCLEEQ